MLSSDVGSVFFSSRRRHTRCLSDWSSDVCSSDLPVHLTVIALVLVVLIVVAVKAATGRGTPVRGGLPSGHAAIAFAGWAAVLFIRSEERRVGKEGRSRWSPYH